MPAYCLLLILLICTTRLCLAQDPVQNPDSGPGTGPGLVQDAEQALANKQYDKALHSYEAADVWFQGKRLTDPTWQPDVVAKQIRICEREILFLPKMIARDTPPHHGETKGYVPAWLAVENGFNLVDSQQYGDALDRFEEADIRLQAIVESDPNWQPLLVNSRLKACEKELVQLPKLLAGLPANGTQPADTQPATTKPEPPTPQPLSDDGTPLTGMPSPTPAPIPSSEPTSTPTEAPRRTPHASNPDLAVIPSIPNLTLQMVPVSPALSVRTPKPAPAVETPTSVPAIETPTPVPLMQTPTPVPVMETPTPAPVIETPTPSPIPSTAPSTEPETTTTTVQNASDPMSVPEDMRHRSELAAQYFREQRYDDAVAYYKIIVAAHPDCANAWMNLGFVRLNQRRYDDAETAMKKAQALDPHDPTITSGLQTIEHFLKKYGNGSND